jgi:hypothetical protein
MDQKTHQHLDNIYTLYGWQRFVRECEKMAWADYLEEERLAKRGYVKKQDK